MDYTAFQVPLSMGILQARILDSPPRNLPTQGLNPGLMHCRWIHYYLIHQRSSRILEWVAYPFSSGTSQPRNWTGISSIAFLLFFYQLSYPGHPILNPDFHLSHSRPSLSILWGSLKKHPFLSNISSNIWLRTYGSLFWVLVACSIYFGHTHHFV